MSLPLFCYGTLELPEVMRAVAGCLPTRLPATLSGYRRAMVAGRNYPGVLPADDTVLGTLYLAPGRTVLARIDRFEGDEYRRRQVTVKTGNGQSRAWVYVLDPQRARLSEVPWDAEAFARDHMHHPPLGRRRSTR